jgi:hypothetical protein
MGLFSNARGTDGSHNPAMGRALDGTQFRRDMIDPAHRPRRSRSAQLAERAGRDAVTGSGTGPENN